MKVQIKNYLFQMFYLALGMWNPQWTLVNSAQQRSQSPTVAGHSLGGGLEFVHALQAPVNKRGQLWGQGNRDAAQAPGRGEARGRTRVDQHWHHRLYDTWNTQTGKAHYSKIWHVCRGFNLGTGYCLNHNQMHLSIKIEEIFVEKCCRQEKLYSSWTYILNDFIVYDA